MENGGIFYVRLVHFMTVWYILWPLGIFCGHLVNYLLVFWYFLVILVYFTSFRLSFQEKSGNPEAGFVVGFMQIQPLLTRNLKLILFA
jgi:hypothetical protein